MRARWSATVALCVGVLYHATVSAQGPPSATLAPQLTALMASHKLGAVAAVEPNSPDRFVAAMVFPGVQLLVVSARHPAPAALQEQMAKKAYSEVYASLQQSAIQDSKLFIQDLDADGLRAKPGAGVDVMIEHVVKQTMFDGHPSKQKLSEAAYAEMFNAADSTYSRLLTLLINELKGATATR